METPNIIKFCQTNEAFGELSNFYKSPFVIDSITYKTVEHYYQSQKFKHSQYHMNLVINSETAREAAKIGRNRSFPLDPEWETIKENVMMTGLKYKFQIKYFKNILKNTGDAQIIEHRKADKYWADGGDGSGKNRLGILLMQLREEMKNNGLNKKM